MDVDAVAGEVAAAVGLAEGPAGVADVRVPDIGDFKDVPVIEVLVKAGDTVAKEDPLISLESDKATMEVPAPQGGVVKELKVKVGDKVSKGSLILVLEAGQDTPPGEEPPEIRDSYSGTAYFDPRFHWTELKVTTQVVSHNNPHENRPPLRKYEQARVLAEKYAGLVTGLQ